MTERAVSEQLDPMLDAMDALRELLLVAQGFRQDLASALRVAISDTFALSHLATADSLTAGELAHRAGLAPSSVTALLDRMERAGLVRRVVPPTDRRSQQIMLTDRGRGVLALSGGWMEAGLGCVPADELPVFVQHLRAVAGALRAQSETFSSTLESSAGLPER